MSKERYILVTGGAGYIGSHTVVELTQRGFTPVIVDDFRNSNQDILIGIKNITGKDAIIHEVDVTILADLKHVFEQYSFEGVIHFAADKAVGESVENPLKYYRNNLISLINCLDLIEQFDVPNLVFSSSCTVYGEPTTSFVVNEETHFAKAHSPYGATKQFGERILEDLNKSGSKLNILSLRYFNPIGAHNSSEIGELPLGRPNNLIPYITQTAIGKRDFLTVFGNDYETEDGTCLRDYIHVTDLAEVHVHGLEWLNSSSKGKFETVNVGKGIGVSVLEIIHTFEKVSGMELNWEFGERRPGDVEQIFADVSKAKQVLNWEASRSVEEAIIDAWNWEKKLKSEN